MDLQNHHPLFELERLADIRIGVIGDVCLDAYLELDESNTERSVETGIPTRAVRRQRHTLGGAGNVVANLRGLGVGGVEIFGVIGEDLFGHEARRLFARLGVDAGALIAQGEGWSTCVYMKPMLGGEELNRIDFGRHNQIAAASEAALLEALDRRIGGLNGLIINQQWRNGIYTPAVIERLNALAQSHPHAFFIVDARDITAQFRRMAIKFNATEAARYCGDEVAPDHDFPAGEVQEMAARIHADTGRPVVITRGSRGLVAQAAGEAHVIPGVQSSGRIDPVGAGDTIVAAVAATLSAGATLREAAEVANLAAAITVRKLCQTGVATPEEIRVLAADVDYMHNPELAEDERRATYLPETSIEVTSEEIPVGQLKHVVFDHDGTISVLREGWEAVMETVMMEQILGPALTTADERTWRATQERVRQFIHQSTGLQTILQMESLVELIREHGYVPAEQIRDAASYKKIYLDALMQRVEDRFARINAGEMHAEDFVVKGAVEFLRALRERGIHLYLASGTDEPDVKAEARLLGYAELFDGGIHGAVDAVSKNSKKMVIERIIREHGLDGPQLACIGDGPVEMREARRQGGLAIGVASDEIRRHGPCMEKRKRLIRAGAQVIIPDFSQGARLLEFLMPAKKAREAMAAGRG